MIKIIVYIQELLTESYCSHQLEIIYKFIAEKSDESVKCVNKSHTVGPESVSYSVSLKSPPL